MFDLITIDFNKIVCAKVLQINQWQRPNFCLIPVRDATTAFVIDNRTTGQWKVPITYYETLESSYPLVNAT